MSELKGANGEYISGITVCGQRVADMEIPEGQNEVTRVVDCNGGKQLLIYRRETDPKTGKTTLQQIVAPYHPPAPPPLPPPPPSPAPRKSTGTVTFQPIILDYFPKNPEPKKPPKPNSCYEPLKPGENTTCFVPKLEIGARIEGFIGKYQETATFPNLPVFALVLEGYGRDGKSVDGKERSRWKPQGVFSRFSIALPGLLFGNYAEILPGPLETVWEKLPAEERIDRKNADATGKCDHLPGYSPVDHNACEKREIVDGKSVPRTQPGPDIKTYHPFERRLMPLEAVVGPQWRVSHPRFQGSIAPYAGLRLFFENESVGGGGAVLGVTVAGELRPYRSWYLEGRVDTYALLVEFGGPPEQGGMVAVGGGATVWVGTGWHFDLGEKKKTPLPPPTPTYKDLPKPPASPPEAPVVVMTDPAFSPEPTREPVAVENCKNDDCEDSPEKTAPKQPKKKRRGPPIPPVRVGAPPAIAASTLYSPPPGGTAAAVVSEIKEPDHCAAFSPLFLQKIRSRSDGYIRPERITSAEAIRIAAERGFEDQVLTQLYQEALEMLSERLEEEKKKNLWPRGIGLGSENKEIAFRAFEEVLDEAQRSVNRRDSGFFGPEVRAYSYAEILKKVGVERDDADKVFVVPGSVRVPGAHATAGQGVEYGQRKQAERPIREKIFAAVNQRYEKLSDTGEELRQPYSEDRLWEVISILGKGMKKKLIARAFACKGVDLNDPNNFVVKTIEDRWTEDKFHKKGEHFKNVVGFIAFSGALGPLGTAGRIALTAIHVATTRKMLGDARQASDLAELAVALGVGDQEEARKRKIQFTELALHALPIGRGIAGFGILGQIALGTLRGSTVSVLAHVMNGDDDTTGAFVTGALAGALGGAIGWGTQKVLGAVDREVRSALGLNPQDEVLNVGILLNRPRAGAPGTPPPNPSGETTVVVQVKGPDGKIRLKEIKGMVTGIEKDPKGDDAAVIITPNGGGKPIAVLLTKGGSVATPVSETPKVTAAGAGGGAGKPPAPPPPPGGGSGGGKGTPPPPPPPPGGSGKGNGGPSDPKGQKGVVEHARPDSRGVTKPVDAKKPEEETEGAAAPTFRQMAGQAGQVARAKVAKMTQGEPDAVSTATPFNWAAGTARATPIDPYLPPKPGEMRAIGLTLVSNYGDKGYKVSFARGGQTGFEKGNGGVKKPGHTVEIEDAQGNRRPVRERETDVFFHPEKGEKLVIAGVEVKTPPARGTTVPVVATQAPAQPPSGTETKYYGGGAVAMTPTGRVQTVEVLDKDTRVQIRRGDGQVVTVSAGAKKALKEGEALIVNGVTVVPGNKSPVAPTTPSAPPRTEQATVPFRPAPPRVPDIGRQPPPAPAPQAPFPQPSPSFARPVGPETATVPQRPSRGSVREIPVGARQTYQGTEGPVTIQRFDTGQLVLLPPAGYREPIRVGGRVVTPDVAGRIIVNPREPVAIGDRIIDPNQLQRPVRAPGRWQVQGTTRVWVEDPVPAPVVAPASPSPPPIVSRPLPPSMALPAGQSAQSPTSPQAGGTRTPGRVAQPIPPTAPPRAPSGPRSPGGSPPSGTSTGKQGDGVLMVTRDKEIREGAHLTFQPSKGTPEFVTVREVNGDVVTMDIGGVTRRFRIQGESLVDVPQPHLSIPGSYPSYPPPGTQPKRVSLVEIKE